MAYATVADVRGRISHLQGVPDARIEAALEGAEGEVDATLSRRYAVPFDPVPKLIKSITLDLATAQVLDDSFSGGGEEEEPKLSQSIRRRALARLRDLKDGVTALPGLTPTGGVLSSTAGQVSSLAEWDLYKEPRPQWPA